MTRLAKTLITATAMLTLMSASAFADGSNDGGVSNILNGQVNLNNQTATLNLSSTNVQGNISGGATAGGNAIDITTMNNTNVINNQYVSTQNIDADNLAAVARRNRLDHRFGEKIASPGRQCARQGGGLRPVLAVAGTGKADAGSAADTGRAAGPRDRVDQKRRREGR